MFLFAVLREGDIHYIGYWYFVETVAHADARSVHLVGKAHLTLCISAPKLNVNEMVGE